MAWKKGPMPKDTRNFGAVVPVDNGKYPLVETGGFYFAEFRGDEVILFTAPHPTMVRAEDVAFYDNSIELPEGITKRLP